MRERERKKSVHYRFRFTVRGCEKEKYRGKKPAEIYWKKVGERLRFMSVFFIYIYTSIYVVYDIP